ncbi:hypothetical protein X975_11067, partial [Stegodyphus mimosarum]
MKTGSEGIAPFSLHDTVVRLSVSTLTRCVLSKVSFLAMA